MTLKKNSLLKDKFFNEKTIVELASEISLVYPLFSQNKFTDEILNKLPELELKQRIYHIRDMLKKHLPNNYKTALSIILKALPKELDSNKTDNDFGKFIYAPYGEFITRYGCDSNNLEISLFALSEITKRFSVEFAIRDFVNDFPKETIAMLRDCSVSPNYHQRRLASEGLRPKLPWGKGITIDYKEPLGILNNLFSDKTRYVTRSVANHLNDIAKVDSKLVIESLNNWSKSKKQNPKEMKFIINHSLRTLVKRGDKEALKLLGFSQKPKINISNFNIKREKVKIGESLEFSLVIKAKQDTKLIIDYILYFQTKNASQSPKVFKLKKINLAKGEQLIISKKHKFKKNMSTRKLYMGAHRICLQINGDIYHSYDFVLLSD